MSFSYLGTVPASKSIYNRLLICQSYFPELQIHGVSPSDDVVLMQKALSDIENGLREIDCGYAGTVLRFLALKVARLGGEWFLKGQPELLRRPHDGLYQILGQLSVDWQMEEDGLWMHSEGWRLQGDGLHVSMKTSSQFLSAVLLNGWNLEDDLYIAINSQPLSAGYYAMTLNLVKALGMDVVGEGKELVLRAGSQCKKSEVSVEPDMSSAFALAAVAAVNGDVSFQNFPDTSLQPDWVFVEVLEKMGVPIRRENSLLKITSVRTLSGIEQDLSSCPDLFPSLAILCGLANGPSRLFGAPHLRFKESDRIAKVVELLGPLGRTLEPTEEGLIISGDRLSPEQVSEWSFHPAKDHRMAMAAAVLKKAGYPIVVQSPEVVSKSFPDFWNVIGEAS